MLSQRVTALVWDMIRALPGKDRPNYVRHAFDLALLNLEQDTGRIKLSRSQLAERMKCTPQTVTRAMSVLARYGVIDREIVPVDGMRGPGVVQYFINEHCGWNGCLEIRRERAARRAQPSLSLVGGS